MTGIYEITSNTGRKVGFVSGLEAAKEFVEAKNAEILLFVNRRNRKAHVAEGRSFPFTPDTVVRDRRGFSFSEVTLIGACDG